MRSAWIACGSGRFAPMKFGAMLVLSVGAASVHAAPTKCTRDCVYEPEPFLQAPALVQTSLLNGPNFRVVPEVQVRGYMARFLIDTRFGPLNADSVELLEIRVG